MTRRRPLGAALTRSGRTQRGSATVLALVLMVALGVAAVAATVLGGLLVAKRRADAAADLAALAGAAALQHGESGCAAAASAASANQADLVWCRRHGAVLDVEVAVEVRAAPGLTAVRGRARAGPGHAGPAGVGAAPG